MSVVLDAVLADCLATECLLVTHVSVRTELPQHTGDDVLEHGVRPDGLHHQRGHHHVAAEIRRVVRKPRHQLLSGAERFDHARLALETPVAGDDILRGPAYSVAGDATSIGTRLGEKGQKLGVEYLRSRKGRE